MHIKKHIMADFKEEISYLLGQFFSVDLLHDINIYYDNDHPEELIDLAKNMLSGLLGDDMAQRRLLPIIAKYHLDK